jgi:hypothetical protein
MATTKRRTTKSKIKIKPQNRGKFTAWCKRNGYKGVTAGCIKKALASRSPSVKKMANFARNSRKWKK